MLLYNVTVTIDKDVAQDWENWMRNSHVPQVMATGLFVSYRMNRLLDHEHPDAEIFTMQYLVQDMDTLRKYAAEFAPALQKDHAGRYAGKYAAFRTVMEIIEMS